MTTSSTDSRRNVMEFSSVALDAEVARQQVRERAAHAAEPRIPATAYRHLLAQRLRRVADRIDT
jgi:hypothetical protein